jgi:hypothetical protein
MVKGSSHHIGLTLQCTGEGFGAGFMSQPLDRNACLPEIAQLIGQGER